MKRKPVLLVICLMLYAFACTPILATTEEPTPAFPTAVPSESMVQTEEVQTSETSIPPTTLPEPTQGVIVELSTSLVKKCKRNDDTDPNLQKGDLAVGFSLMDIDGEVFTLSELLKEKPVALIYGSFT